MSVSLLLGWPYHIGLAAQEQTYLIGHTGRAGVSFVVDFFVP